jgi:hypothetical protein
VSAQEIAESPEKRPGGCLLQIWEQTAPFLQQFALCKRQKKNFAKLFASFRAQKLIFT